MTTPDAHPDDSTSPGPDDGTDVGTGEVTGAGAGTTRDDYGKDGTPRPASSSSASGDSGATDRAAQEVAADNEDEPTRSE
ncbi:hypothetical protein EV383_4938 [Pseudonocardia sediminis]|uniref:Uncharacterized protein n=1 Tax=Pseudonocardia sediminis TaxID=1397368 RepID=A0A4Q7V3D1_PSEST|nr:hypothetical protein [Pseudonocardia sediminis]RZT88004.1 hypothetical protein EV383_4938 [Pseudonocardia sediminis]